MADRDNNYKAAVFQLYSIANKKNKNGILISKLISCQGLLEDIDLIVTEKPSLKNVIKVWIIVVISWEFFNKRTYGIPKARR